MPIKKYNRYCLECNKSFTANRSDKIFCKPSCKFKYWQKNNRRSEDRRNIIDRRGEDRRKE